MTLKRLSPSSINLYKQCPRKFFYQYIMKLPTKGSIHLVRGSAVHDALEKFFELKPSAFSDGYFEFEMKTVLLDFFRQAWEGSQKELDKLDMKKEDLLFYFGESKRMLENWVESFIDNLKKQKEKRGSLAAAFSYLAPITEKHYFSESDKVHGFIDAIHHYEDGIHILDYKTSKKDTMSGAYKLQLAIYALLYQKEHGVAPKRVGINFLKFGEKYLEVDQLLIDEARKEVAEVFAKTRADNISAYPKNVTPLCKWSTGQCDFYETCSQSRSLHDFGK